MILILPSTSSTNGCELFTATSTTSRNVSAIDYRSSRPISTKTSTQPTTTTTTKCFVRHITRVNISDVYSQELDGDDEPVTKEGKLFSCLFFFFKIVAILF